MSVSFDHYRHLIIFHGQEKGCIEQLIRAFEEKKERGNYLYIGKAIDSIALFCEVITVQQISTILGREFDYVIINAYSGFNPNALGAASGTVKAGGYLIIITPEFNCWPSYPDPDYQRFLSYPYTAKDATGYFLQWIQQQLQASNDVFFITLDDAINQLTLINVFLCCKPLFKTRSTWDQNKAVVALINVVNGHRKRPLVLTADRGRGKSAALGIAAGQLMREKSIHIVVTAPSRNTILTLFKHCREALLLDTNSLLEDIIYQQSSCRYIEPHRLLDEMSMIDFLLVDEAAMLPVALLKNYLQRCSRIAFSTTQHGYEGSGRGFSLRFKQYLDQKAPNWKEIQLIEPIRWLANDPLERLTSQLLLLEVDSCHSINTKQRINLMDCSYERVNRYQLKNNSKQLKELFGLLVLAHYQTRPSDLRWLLDSPDIHCATLSYQRRIIAVVIFIKEGNIKGELAQQIVLGKRRPHGHQVAQTLACQVGVKKAVCLLGQRIVRIAVHPHYQNQGLGQYLLSQSEQYYCALKHFPLIDYLSTSFGATPSLVSFWQRQGYFPVRLGMKKDQASGVYSVVMLKPLSIQGKALVNQVQLRFNESFPWLLQRHYSGISSRLIQLIFKSLNHPATLTLDPNDRLDIKAFYHGRRYETAEYALFKQSLSYLFSTSLQQKNNLNSEECSLLINKIILGCSWKKMAKKNKLGMSALQQQLRTIIKKIY